MSTLTVPVHLHGASLKHDSWAPTSTVLNVCACTGGAAGSGENANRLYDPDLYHLSSQQSTQLSSRLMDLVYTNPWHPLARKHLTTASAYSPMSGRERSLSTPCIAVTHETSAAGRCDMKRL